MERYIETLFRHKWLFLFLLVLIPTLGTGYALDQREVLYQASATVWAEKPVFLDTIGDWNQWITPAQNQAGNVQEMLQTDKFDLEVLAQTDLKTAVLTPAGQVQTVNGLRKNTAILPTGTHLVVVEYSDKDPQVAAQVVMAIINSFNKEMLQNANAQSTQALSYYQQQLAAANTKVANTTAALNAYLQAHPELLQPSSTGQPTVQLAPLIANAAFAAQHPDLVKLSNDQQDAVKQQQDLQAQMLQIEQQQSSNSAAADETFKVMDAAAPPSKPLSILRKFALQIGLSVGAAIGFVVAGLLILTLLDTSLRSGTVAAARLHLPVLATVPQLKRRRRLFSRRRFRQRDVRALLALEGRAPSISELG